VSSTVTCIRLAKKYCRWTLWQEEKCGCVHQTVYVVTTVNSGVNSINKTRIAESRNQLNNPDAGAWRTTMNQLLLMLQRWWRHYAMTSSIPPPPPPHAEVYSSACGCWDDSECVTTAAVLNRPRRNLIARINGPAVPEPNSTRKQRGEKNKTKTKQRPAAGYSIQSDWFTGRANWLQSARSTRTVWRACMPQEACSG